MLRFISFLLLVLFLGACGSKSYDIKGLWINAAQFVVTKKDTVWDRRNIIWELEDSVFNVYQVNYRNVEMLSAPANWTIRDKKLSFKSPIAEESWEIIHQSADSLVLKLEKSATPMYWTFSRMKAAPKTSIDTNAIRSFLDNGRFDIEGPTIAKVMDYPLQIQFKADKFFVYNVAQIQNNMLLWGAVNFKDRPILLLNSILSKQLNHLDMVEIIALEGDKLQGRYFKDGKAYPLTMTKR